MSTENKTPIIVEDVLEMLENGKTRDEIQEHYGLTNPELKQLFKHPELKGKKTKKVVEVNVMTRAELEAQENLQPENNTESVETKSEEVVAEQEEEFSEEESWNQ